MAETLDHLYLHKQSYIHGLNIWTKFISFLLILPVGILFADTITLMFATALCMVLVISSHISLPAMWGRVGTYVLAYTAIFVPVAFFWGTGPSWMRLQAGVIFALKMTDVTLLGVLFAMVTDPIELPLGLLLFRLPQKYGVALMVAYRMLPLIGDKLGNVIQAQKSRGADFHVTFRRLPQNFRAVISLMIPLVSASLEASAGLADTLIARGYSPDRKITSPPFRTTIWDVVLPMALILGLIGVTAIK